MNKILVMLLIAIVTTACGGGGGSGSNKVVESPRVMIHPTNQTEFQEEVCGEKIWRLPDAVDPAYDTRWSGVPYRELKWVTSIRKDGGRSVALLFVVDRPRGTVIYHQGHRGDVIHGYGTIKFFVESGYNVAAFAMPTESHSSLPLCSFVSPVLRFLNLDLVKPVFMVGISGGGWTTSVVAAMTNKLTRSYPVAGTLPLDVHSNADGKRDWEQLEVARILGYRPLYRLAVQGGITIYNDQDPCCFAINQEKATSVFESVPYWKAVVVHNSKHSISKKALDIILKDILKI